MNIDNLKRTADQLAELVGGYKPDDFVRRIGGQFPWVAASSALCSGGYSSCSCC